MLENIPPEDLFANIPPEIMIDILSRLPIPSVMSCKCVCKSWMELVESLEFAKSHVSKCLAPGEDLPLTLSLFHDQGSLNTYTIIGLVETRNSGHPFNVVFKFNSPRNQNLRIHSSANGLLLMLNEDGRNLSICNPITREYIKLPPLSLYPPISNPSSYLQNKAFGFGVSKVTGKYKVVRVCLDCDGNLSGDTDVINTSKCEVYTLGTVSWRRVAAGGPHRYYMLDSCVFLNGNLHWLVRGRMEMGDFLWSISYFDLENEYFSTLSIPVCIHSFRNLCTLRGSLCLCSNDRHNVEIWLMNKYGDDKSWRKLELVIENKLPCHELYVSLMPQQMSKDGDILFAMKFRPQLLYCYSSKTRTITQVQLTTKSLGYTISCKTSINYAPSFLPLQTFTMEDVTTF